MILSVGSMQLMKEQNGITDNITVRL